MRLWKGLCIKHGCLAGHKNELFCLFAAFITADPKGKWVVCGSEDNSIYIWDLNKKEVSQSVFTSLLCPACYGQPALTSLL